MANLASVTRESRFILKIGAGILSAVILIYFLFQGYSFVKKLTSPPEPPKQAFGKLPSSIFPSNGTPGINFNINTVEGNLPTFPDRANVFTIIPPQPSLLDLSSSKKSLESAGFIENQTKLSDTVYQWAQTKTGIIIQYNIVTKNFTITSNYLSNPTLSSTSLLPAEEDLKKDVISFLQVMDINTDDIDLSKSTVEYLQNNGSQLIKAENFGSAKFARVILVQNEVDKTDMVYESPTTSLLNFVISYPSSSNMQVVEGQFFHYKVNTEEKSDYPIKTATQAFDDLKKGNAYMINPQNLTNVDITNLELKYYIGREMNGYLLPVYLFTGINFAGYVEAIPSSSLTTPAN